MRKTAVAVTIVLVLLVAACIITDKPFLASSEISSQNYEVTVDNVAYSLVATSDGGFALAGSTRLFRGLLSETAAFWLVKTDTFGNVKWNQTYGETGFNIAYSLVETSDGGFALTGYTASYGAGSTD